MARRLFCTDQAEPGVRDSGVPRPPFEPVGGGQRPPQRCAIAAITSHTANAVSGPSGGPSMRGAATKLAGFGLGVRQMMDALLTVMWANNRRACTPRQEKCCIEHRYIDDFVSARPRTFAGSG